MAKNTFFRGSQSLPSSTSSKPRIFSSFSTAARGMKGRQDIAWCVSISWVQKRSSCPLRYASWSPGCLVIFLTVSPHSPRPTTQSPNQSPMKTPAWPWSRGAFGGAGVRSRPRKGCGSSYQSLRAFSAGTTNLLLVAILTIGEAIYQGCVASAVCPALGRTKRFAVTFDMYDVVFCLDTAGSLAHVPQSTPFHAPVKNVF